MPRHLTFGPPEGPTAEPITFTLRGRGWEETFTTLPEPPAGVLAHFLNGVQTDNRGRTVYAAGSLMSFMRGVLRDTQVVVTVDGKLPDDLVLSERETAQVELLGAGAAREQGHYVPAEVEDGTEVAVVPADDEWRFLVLCNDKSRLLAVETLGLAVKGLVTEFTNRPTRPSGA